MTYPSFEAFAKDQVSIFNELKEVDKVLRGALLDSLAIVKGRIQQDGLNSQEANIGTYSKGWAKFRKSKGRQTDHIDLTLEGTLMRNFSIIPDGNDALGIGFTSDTEAKKAEQNELRFKSKIFDLSESEQDFIEKEINSAVAKIFSRIQ
jgi:hypothetical protein